jgi:hypothetical protein
MKKLRQIASIILVTFVICLATAEQSGLAYENATKTHLKDLALSDDDIKSVWGINFEGFSTQTDITYELKNLCYIDCVKQIWSASNKISSDYITVTLLRSRNPENARRSIQSLWETYSALGSIFYPYQKLTEDKNSWSGIVNYPGSKFQYIACNVQDSVVVIVSHRMIIHSFIADIDSAEYLDRVEKLAEIQKEKLSSVGVAP